MQDKKSKKQKQLVNKNFVEAFKDIGSSMANTVKNDVAKGIAKDFWAQMIGAENYSQNTKQTAGELKAGEELELASIKQTAEAALNVEPGIDYKREILQVETRAIKEDRQHIEVKVQEIIIELKRLMASSKELQAQFKQIAVEQMPVEAGKYHVTFFEWVVSMIRIARGKVEDSASWLALFSSKKNKKQYWSMFKKHGTTFGLSNERVVSTQTG